MNHNDGHNENWHGLAPEPVDPNPDLTTQRNHSRSEDSLDMTPMVDITFLLLIFFMVTASFTLVRTIETPPAVSDPGSPMPTPDVEQPDFVQVTIDQNGSYFVASGDSEIEAPSDREMRARLKDAVAETGCQQLEIRAHVDSTHNKVVKVWDHGIALGMRQVELETVDFEY